MVWMVINLIVGVDIHSCKLTNRHGKSTILMVFTRKAGIFMGYVSFGVDIPIIRITPSPGGMIIHPQARSCELFFACWRSIPAGDGRLKSGRLVNKASILSI